MKPGATIRPSASIDPVGEARRPAADLGDLAVLDPDVAPVAWHPGAVDDRAALDVDVEICHGVASSFVARADGIRSRQTSPHEQVPCCLLRLSRNLFGALGSAGRQTHLTQFQFGTHSSRYALERHRRPDLLGRAGAVGRRRPLDAARPARRVPRRPPLRGTSSATSALTRHRLADRLRKLVAARHPRARALPGAPAALRVPADREGPRPLPRHRLARALGRPLDGGRRRAARSSSCTAAAAAP